MCQVELGLLSLRGPYYKMTNNQRHARLHGRQLYLRFSVYFLITINQSSNVAFRAKISQMKAFCYMGFSPTSLYALFHVIRRFIKAQALDSGWSPPILSQDSRTSSRVLSFLNEVGAPMVKSQTLNKPQDLFKTKTRKKDIFVLRNQFLGFQV